MKLTRLGQLIIVAALLAAAYFSIRRFAPGLKDEIAPLLESDPPEATPAAAVSGATDCSDLPEVRLWHQVWNAQMGILYAAGGKQATKGSLMCRSGVNLKLVREDDTDILRAALITYADKLASGELEPAEGAPFVSISGDGAAVFIKQVNDGIRSFGPGYQLKIVGSAGYSRGEDKFLGPPAWKDDPNSARGGLVSGVFYEGGWNLAQKWLRDNGVCNNPDETTYDPNCLNWDREWSPLSAAKQYVDGHCELRAVVDKGRLVGEKRKVCTDAVVTRTPGDVIVVKDKGGLATIISSEDDLAQMPNVIVGIDRWMRSHRATVESMLSAIFEGSYQVRVNGGVFHRAAEISAEIYDQPGADTNYWLAYYMGVNERDRTGITVALGGSAMSTLDDNLRLFGVRRGTPNLFGETYKMFGDIAVEQYPDLFPDYPPLSEVLDTSYIEGIAASAPPAPPTP
jgi:OmpA-OmpF porin, OOP family